MSGPDPRAVPARPAGRSGGLIGALIAGLALVIGFCWASSLAGLISAHVLWLLGVGLGVALIIPALLGVWLRNIGGRRQRPSTASMVSVCNLALVLGGVLLAPQTSARALREHGHWWAVALVRLVADEGRAEAAEGRARVLWARVAGWLPGESVPAKGVKRSGKGRAKRPVKRGGEAPSPPAPQSPPPPALPDPVSLGAKGEVRVEFERRDSGIVVPVTIGGPAGSVRAKMLFDTGATLSTIDSATLRRLGLYVSAADPQILTHTAAGSVRRRITIVDSIALGVARVEGGLTVSICDPCASGRAVGLLGLNFSRHFQVTFDHEEGVLTLKAKRKAVGHLYDIRPFVELSDARGVRRGPQLTVNLMLHNKSPRPLRQVRVAAVVKPHRIWVDVPRVPARSRLPVKISGLIPDKGGNVFRPEVTFATW